MRNDAVEITWRVDDGYAGGDRPQSVEIDAEDIAACESEEEVRELVEVYISEAFSESIGPSWGTDEEDKVVEAWRKLTAAQAVEEGTDGDL